MLLQFLENHSLLIFINVFNRFEHLHLIAILFCSLYQRLNIFRETRTSIATTRIKEFAADTRVATDALAHHIHSAPTSSQRLAMSFINEMRVASIEFAAYFIISALGMSVKITRKLLSITGR